MSIRPILPSLLAALVCMAVGSLQAADNPPQGEASGRAPREAVTLRGTDQVIAPAAQGRAVQGGGASFKFENTPLADVVHIVLREVLKVDHVIHPPINGAVTLATVDSVEADEAVYLLEAALSANGYQLAVDARGTYHVGKPELLRSLVPAVRQARPGALPPGQGAIIVPLRHIGATEMAAILRPLASEEAILRVDTVRNLLVLGGSRAQAEGWLEMVNTFDVDLLKGMSVGVFPLKHITTREVDEALRLLAAGVMPASAAAGRAAAAPNPAASPATGLAATARAASEGLPPGFPLHGLLRVLPIERLNSIIVVTPRAAYLDEARAWIEKLDRPGYGSQEPQLFVYRVQNGSARHLAEVMSGLFGGAAAGGGTGGLVANGVAPGLASAGVGGPALISAGRPSANMALGAGTLGASGAAALAPGSGQSSLQGSGVTSMALAGGVRVIADELNNSVLVYGTPMEFEQIETTLKRLDLPPTQVLIEASIIEVSLNDELQYGVQWLFTDRHGSDTGTGVLSTAAGGVLGGAPAGFSYTLRNAAGNVRAVLNALASKSLVKVISSPALMVLDNHTASITVGTQQPIRSSETITTGGNVSTSVQYKDTGVSLAVTPSVNAGNMVTMQLTQSVTDVGNVDVATGQRTFQQRQVGSKVAVRAGETLVLGGLIRDNNTAGNNGLPGLKDVPVFGALFGQRNSAQNRTELLIVITPQVVRSSDEARAAAAELKARMKGLPAFEALQQPAR